MKLFSKMIIAAALLFAPVMMNAQNYEFMKWKQPKATGVESVDNLLLSVSAFHETAMSTVDIPVFSVKYVTSNGITNAFIVDENGNVRGTMETINQIVQIGLATTSAIASGTMIVADLALAVASVPELLTNPFAIPAVIAGLTQATKVIKADIAILKEFTKAMKAQRLAIKALKTAGTDATALENAKVMLQDANMTVTEEVVDEAKMQELLAQQELLDEGIEEMEEVGDDEI